MLPEARKLLPKFIVLLRRETFILRNASASRLMACESVNWPD